MTYKVRAFVNAFCWLKMPVLAFMAVFTLLAVQSTTSLAQPPAITLTKVGSPIWRPVDFQLFTAPANPFPAAFNHTIDLLLPLEGPGAATYTPHSPPYNTELSTNAAAAGFVNQSVFPVDAITFNPNARVVRDDVGARPGRHGFVARFCFGAGDPKLAVSICFARRNVAGRRESGDAARPNGEYSA